MTTVGKHTYKKKIHKYKNNSSLTNANPQLSKASRNTWRSTKTQHRTGEQNAGLSTQYDLTNDTREHRDIHKTGQQGTGETATESKPVGNYNKGRK